MGTDDAQDPTAQKSLRRRNVAFFAVAAGLTSIACAVLLLHPFPFGVPGEWVWEVAGDIAWFTAGPFVQVAVVFLVVVGVAAWRIGELRRYTEAALIAGLVAFVMLMQLMLGIASQGGLRESFVALSAPGASNVYYAQAIEIRDFGDLRQFLKDYRVIAKQSDAWQLKTHPPGATVFFWAIHRFYQACPERLVRAAITVPEAMTPAVEDGSEIALLVNLPERQKAGIWTAVFALWLAAASTIVPVYLWGRALYGKQIALYAAAFTGLIPSLLLFSPLIDQLYPPLAAWICYLSWVALGRRSMLAAGVAGALAFVGMFFTVAFLAVIALVAIMFVAREIERIDQMVEPDHRGRQHVLLGAAVTAVAIPAWFIATSALPPSMRPSSLTFSAFLVAAEIAAIWTVLRVQDEAGMGKLAAESLPLAGAGLVGFLVLVIAVVAGLGHDIVGSWRHSFEMNREFNITTHRSHWLWMAANPPCFVAYLGVPITCLFARRLWLEPDSVSAAVAVVLVMLWGTGQNLGEVERLWMLAMPLCAMAGAATLRAFGRYAGAPALAFLALQAAQLIILKMCIHTVRLTG